MKRIFISYRRDDSRYQARMVYSAFAATVSRENVFMDVDSIPPGANFRKILKGWVDECDALLALIGPDWIDVVDAATNARRLDNPSDFVRIEISEALARDIPVVPVLLDGAPLPHPNSLPDDLKELCDRQAEFVEYRTFDADVARLIKKLGLGQQIAEAPLRAEQFQPVVQPSPQQTAEQRLAQYRAEGRIEVAAQRFHPEGNEAVRGGLLKPGAGKVEWFQDLDIGPEMVVVPGGSGIAPFAIGRFMLTFAEWDAAQKHPQWQEHSGIAPREPKDHGWGHGKQPVIDVSWEDAQAYCRWLSHVTDKTYRMPSEAEWEHACRAGSKTKYWWGDDISEKQANFGSNRHQTVPVESYKPNPWGLYQVHGNVWEWCEDAYGTSSRVVRGGSWSNDPDALRSSVRLRGRPVERSSYLGFRVARTL